MVGGELVGEGCALGLGKKRVEGMCLGCGQSHGQLLRIDKCVSRVTVNKTLKQNGHNINSEQIPPKNIKMGA